MKYEMVGLCEAGFRRGVNQDAVFWAKSEEAAVCVVADGMGGHNNGEIASNLIRQTVLQCWDELLEQEEPVDFRDALTGIQTRLEQANQELYREYGREWLCGSTLVLLFCCQGQYGILYAGDSRVYLRKHFSFSRLTTDEVWENQTSLTEAERNDPNHPDRGKLVNAFGSNPELHMRMATDELKGGELFLLCSDGLYKMCSDRQIRRAMGKARGGGDMMKLALMDLKRETEAGGARDNFSIIMLKADKE